MLILHRLRLRIDTLIMPRQICPSASRLSYNGRNTTAIMAPKTQIMPMVTHAEYPRTPKIVDEKKSGRGMIMMDIKVL